jgi:hypothetical protein
MTVLYEAHYSYGKQKIGIAAELFTNDISNALRQGGRTLLLKLKQRSIRNNNSWFRVLSLEKRRFIEAVIQTVEKIRSSLLIKLLAALAEKLLRAIGGVRGLIGELAYEMHSFGRPLAQRISRTAAQWGNSLAVTWANDEGFIRFLTVVDMNNLSFFREATKR